MSKTVVFYVAHVDDEILGAGGLIPQILEQGHDIHIVYGTNGYIPQRDIDTRPYAEEAATVLGIDTDNIHFLGFNSGRFDEPSIREFNDRFYTLGLEPDLIFTHDQDDFHPDHHVINKSAKVVGRSIDREVRLATMEILSSSEYDQPAFDPNYYVDISGQIEPKIEAMGCVRSELNEWPHPRSEQGIRVKAKQRGMEVGHDLAEAFRIVRWFDWDEPLY
jgi:LmbE family N-acetylglucosaminyl deacetylase